MTSSRWISLGAALIVVAALYGGAWFAAAGEAGRRMDTWLTNEAALGRRWTCPERRIGGFPFAITVDCTDATFSAQGRGHEDHAKLAHVSATVSIFQPSRLALALRAPMSYASADGTTSLSARWTAFDVVLHPLSDPRAADLSGTDVSFEGTFGSPGRQSGRMATVAAHVAQVEGAEAADPTLGFTVAVGGTDLAPLDDLFGDVEAATIDLAGQIDHAGIGAASTPEDIVEAWRVAGGRVDLRDGRLSRGTAALSATGTVGLDDAHRPQGRLQAQFVGLGPVLRRYGIDPGLVAAGSLLSNLLGGGHHRGTTQPGAISLPIDLHDGRLGIGPITTPVALPPLY